jgi:hypothetical protein
MPDLTVTISWGDADACDGHAALWRTVPAIEGSHGTTTYDPRTVGSCGNLRHPPIAVRKMGVWDSVEAERDPRLCVRPEEDQLGRAGVERADHGSSRGFRRSEDEPLCFRDFRRRSRRWAHEDHEQAANARIDDWRKYLPQSLHVLAPSPSTCQFSPPSASPPPPSRARGAAAVTGSPASRAPRGRRRSP